MPRNSSLAAIFASSLLSLIACPRAKSPTPPAPPEIRVERKSYPRQAPPRPGDMLIRNCTVTREDENKADCICRKASTKIDVNEQQKQVMVCK